MTSEKHYNTMNCTFLWTAILVLLSSGKKCTGSYFHFGHQQNRITGCEVLDNPVDISGLCRGAGVITADSLRGTAGESVTFTTSLKPAAEQFLVLTWSLNGTINIITSTSRDVVGPGYENRITLDKSTGSLVLRNLTAKDSREYDLMNNHPTRSTADSRDC